MFFLTTVLLCVLALAQAVPMNTVWRCGDRVTVKWDTSRIPAEDDFPGMLVLDHLEGDSEYLDVDHLLAHDFPLRAGSVEFTVTDVNLVGSDYIVVLFGDSGDRHASPEFTIKSRSELVKKAPQEPDPSEDT
ncbi:hypothetical protein BC826DRAFT_971084 [Russula brevipes]|nr:hypothetical protein BC826DRAFT_971084 [Russula brevipes]